MVSKLTMSVAITIQQLETIPNGSRRELIHKVNLVWLFQAVSLCEKKKSQKAKNVSNIFLLGGCSPHSRTVKEAGKSIPQV